MKRDTNLLYEMLEIFEIEKYDGRLEQDEGTEIKGHLLLLADGGYITNGTSGARIESADIMYTIPNEWRITNKGHNQLAHIRRSREVGEGSAQLDW